ncbi:MAG: diacylglycerol/lipid kinase family protein [Sphingobacteriaceae bacterium]
MKKKVLFIINPIAGGKAKDHVPDLINSYLDMDTFEPAMVFTSKANHAFQLAKDALQVYDLIVAVGGDGTINEVASALVGKHNILGIIPQGSGNGLARFLKIPLKMEPAINNLNHYRSVCIDAAKLNDRYFFNMAGIGFDAHISALFAQNRRRGFRAYFRSIIQEIAGYKAQKYRLTIDELEFEREAFMISFANSSQYGNNAHVSPKASVKDGLIDVCVIKPFPIYKFPMLALRLFTKTAQQSVYVEIIRGKNIKVIRSRPDNAHVDGEPQYMGSVIEVKVLPETLNVLAGATYKD